MARPTIGDLIAFLKLGETSGTAYRGDRGKEAYDHKSVTTGNPHSVTKTEVGLANVTNDAQLPIAGGTMTGKLYTQNNTDYTTAQARKIVLSTGDPSGGGNGDVWIKYTP